MLFKTGKMVMFIMVIIFAGACDDGSSSSDTDSADTESNGDTSKDTTQSTGSDDVKTPYDMLDCDGLGQTDPESCEYEICRDKESYINRYVKCEQNPTEDCEQEMKCRQTFFACMIEACPAGTKAPADKDGKTAAGFYDCDNDLTECLPF